MMIIRAAMSAKINENCNKLPNSQRAMNRDLLFFNCQSTLFIGLEEEEEEEGINEKQNIADRNRVEGSQSQNKRSEESTKPREVEEFEGL